MHLLHILLQKFRRKITLIHTPKCGGTYLNQQYNIQQYKNIEAVGHAYMSSLQLPEKTQIVRLIREPTDWYAPFY